MKLRFVIIVFLAFLLASCSKLNMDNYRLLETGMKYDEVTHILGSPKSCNEKFGARRCIWGDSEGSHIKAKFLGETAISFSHSHLK